jgi:choice-of-anchor C domain-containing protein
MLQFKLFAFGFSLWVASGVVVVDDGCDLVVNGSFEERNEGAPNNYIETLTARTDALAGWEVIGPDEPPSSDSALGPRTVDWIGPKRWAASDGEHCLDLDSGIRQLLSTEPGKRYRLRFDMAGNPENEPKHQRLNVMLGKHAHEFEFDAAGKTKRDLGWVTKEIEFVADKCQTMLSFINAKPNGYSAGVALDNVRVAAVVDDETETMRQLYVLMRRFEREAEELRRAGRDIDSKKHAEKAAEFRRRLETKLGIEE